jgi:hypothetical protein
MTMAVRRSYWDEVKRFFNEVLIAPGNCIVTVWDLFFIFQVIPELVLTTPV